MTLNNVTQEGDEWGDFILAKDASEAFQRVELRLWMESLPDVEFRILMAMYMSDYTQQQVAECLHISQQHVSRLKGRAFRVLREEALRDGIQ